MKQQALFLCTGNYYRSRFAEELFNHCAKQGNLNWVASSRGLALERGLSNIGPVSPYVRDALRKRNIFSLLSEHLPEACTLDDLTLADMVIALNEIEHRELLKTRFPGWEDQAIYWSIHDADISDPIHALASIDLEITRLIKRIQLGCATISEH